MKLQFLCSNHRLWLADNPGAALRTWQQAFDKGQDLAAAGSLRSAINHAGCALESSDILLEHSPHINDSDITRFNTSCAFLAQLLCQLGEDELAHITLQSALMRLQGLLTRGEHQDEIAAGLKALSTKALQLRLHPARRGPTRPHNTIH